MINKEDILLQTHKKLFSIMKGEHNTIFSGEGLEFKELRQYNTNDDIRHINWKVTSRSQNPTVNIFEEKRELNIVVVYLNSGGIYFGTQKSKQDTMIELLTSLSYASVVNSDKITSIFFSKEDDIFYKPTKHKSIIDINMNTAYEQNPLGKNIDFKALSFFLEKKIKQKSLIFLIGDFLDFDMECRLGALGFWHGLFALIVRDKFEEELAISGEFDMIDTNTQKKSSITLSPKQVKKYQDEMKLYDTKLSNYFSKNNIRHQKVYTTDNSVSKLKKIVSF
jgi:hypothetical protein